MGILIGLLFYKILVKPLPSKKTTIIIELSLEIAKPTSLINYAQEGTN